MAYTKTNWQDRQVQYPNRYTKSGDSPTEVTLTPSPGAVTAEGTPISAANMNKIEQGIAAVDAAVEGMDASVGNLQSALDAHESNSANPHNVTKTQIGLGNVQDYGVASQAQAQAGAVNAAYMTPLRTKEYVDQRLLNNFRWRVGANGPEYSTDGVVWQGMGNVVAVASNTVQWSQATEYSVTSTTMLVAKFTPRATGEINISAEVRIDGAGTASNLSVAQPRRATTSSAGKVYGEFTEYNWTMPLGTITSSVPRDTLFSEPGSTYVLKSAIVTIYELSPIYLFLSCGNGLTAYVRNIKASYDLV